MATRRQVVDDPRSGARPLFGDEQTTMPAPPKSTSTRATSQRRTAPTKPLPVQTAAATPPAAAATSSGAVPPPAPDASPSASSSDSEAPTSSPGGANYGTEGAGAMLALFVFPLAINLLNGGPSLMWGWVKAKWFNAPYGGQTAPGPSTHAADPQTMPVNPLTKLYTLPTNYPGAA